MYNRQIKQGKTNI
uniref:Uncharacterized protein n=1 Tax=Arundo donax TaxID=35708 RepID=A0A0A9H879_ARUDO